MASKSGQPEPEKVEVEELLDVLDKALDRVKVLYEQYFLGMQKQPPQFLHTDVERKLRDLSHVQIRNTALRYRFVTIQQKFGAYNAYWRRTLRQIENGTYIRNLSKLTRQAAQTGEEIPDEILAAMPKRMREQVRRDREVALAVAGRRLLAQEARAEAAPVDELDPPTDLRKQPAKTIGGAHILDESDGDLDLDAFFADMAKNPTRPPPMAPAPVRTIPPRKPPPRARPPTEPAPVMSRTATREKTGNMPAIRTKSSPSGAHPIVDAEGRTRSPTRPNVLTPPVGQQAVNRPRQATPPGTQPLARPQPPPPPARPVPESPVTLATPIPNKKTMIPTMPHVPRTPSPMAPSQVTRPNPIVAGSSTAMPAIPVETLTGPFPRTPVAGQKPPPVVPHPQPRAPAGRAAPDATRTPQRISPPAGMTDADVNALYAKYVKAKEMVGETAGPGAYGKLLQTINAQAPKIMEQYKAKGVDFSVVVKDNQVIIRAKPKP